jgi:plastocyanin
MNRIGLILALVLVVAACGDDEGATNGPPQPASVDVVAGDMFFDPDTVTVSAGGQVTVNVTNTGGLEHTWTLLSDGPDLTTAVGLDEGRIIAEVIVGVGDSASVTFTAPGAGVYQVICTIVGHLEAGMEGTLIVSG